MERAIRRSISFGVAALAAAFAATAATIPSPYRPIASASEAVALAAEGQEGLDLDAKALAALRLADKVVELDGFPTAPGSSGRLRLHRFEIAAPDARITIEGRIGPTSQPLPVVSHFSGIVEGEPDSSVYLGVTPDGLVAWVHSKAGHAYVGPDETRRGYVVRVADSPLNAAAALSSWNCGSEELPAALAAPPEEGAAAPKLPNLTLKQAAVRVETDNQLYLHFGSDVNALSAYVLTLFGAVNVIYNRDLSLYLVVAEIHVWSVPDPYNGGDTQTQLGQLGDWWHANKPIASNPRTMVHYLSGHAVTGGIAWLSVLCSADFNYGGHWGGGYGLTQVYGTYPLQLWDQDASAHEMGHNTGSPHTHCMGPPTYPDWTDKCYSGEGSGCFAGAATPPAPGAGTIMSYCHLFGWQYISLVFHPRCINDKMLPEINSASCLTTPIVFADVLPSDPFVSYIDTVYTDGITSGCGTSPLIYCPQNSVTRAQMAVFILKAVHGSAYTPSGCVGVFTDVPCSNSFAPWIEELYAEGITGGCGTGTTYCPGNPVTRQQMAAFLLKAEHGSAYAPPACASNPFTDVACPGTFTNWIQQLVAEGITGGCGGGYYCPTSPVTRGQMAVFLVKTFGL